MEHTTRTYFCWFPLLFSFCLLAFSLQSSYAELRFIGETPVASRYYQMEFDTERELIYCADGYGLFIIDFSDPWEPEIIGRCPTSGLAKGATFDGELVFITENNGIYGQNSLVVFNTEDPRNPELVACWQPPERGEGGTRGRALGVATRNGLLYLTHGLESPGQPDRHVNLSTFRPSHDGPPELLSTVEVPASTQLFPVGDYLYLSAVFTMNLVSIEDPERPEFIDTFNGMWCSLTRWRDYVISAGPFNAVTFYDVRDPADPEQAVFFNADTSVHRVSINDDMMAVNRMTTWRLYGLWDFPDIELAFDGDEQDDPQVWIANTLVLCNQVLVTGHNEYGLRFFDLDDPFQPELYEQFPQPPQVSEVHLGGNILTTFYEKTEHLATFLVEGDGRLELLGQLHVPRANRLKLHDNLAYAPCGRFGFRIIDLAEPADPQVVGVWELEMEDERYVKHIAISEDGGTMYSVRSQRALSMFDVSDPEDPRFIRDFYDENAFYEMQVLGNRLFTTRDNRLAVFDIEEPRDPRLLVNADIPCGREAFVIPGDYIFAARRTPFALRVLDISDIGNPELVFERSNDRRIHTSSLVVKDNLLIQLIEEWGMILWDISDPTHPDSIGWVDTPGEAYDGCWIDDELIIADNYTLRTYTYIEPPPPPGFRLNLPIDWSMISSPVIPDDRDIEAVFAGIVEHGNLHIANDYLGHFYIPDQFNNIPPWDVNQGYQVKLFRPDSLLFFGEIVPPDQRIPLRRGWSMAAYFPEEEVEAPDAFRNIEDALIISKDGEGHFYVPEHNFNNIPPLHRGAGYQVKVREETELVWNVPERAASQPGVTLEPCHFIPPAPTGDFLPVLITSITVKGIQPATGDEVGVFTAEDLCIGAAVVTNELSIGVAVWKDDETTEEIDGYRYGESFYFYYWDSDKGIQLGPDSLTVSLSESEEPGCEIPAYMLHDLSITGSSATVTGSFSLGPVFPNPFNSSISVCFELPEDTDVP